MGEDAKQVKFRSDDSIEEFVTELLGKLGIERPEVPVEKIANELGLLVEYMDIHNDISGLLVLDDEVGAIGVNSNHAPVRQRFTIAHEIGHFCLHRTITDLFIDSEFEPKFRDKRSARGKNPEEIQANKFAAAILMPQVFLKACIEEQGIDIADDDQVKKLAALFNVSLAAMTYRLANRGFLV